jgi:hypothetical protein
MLGGLSGNYLFTLNKLCEKPHKIHNLLDIGLMRCYMLFIFDFNLSMTLFEMDIQF